MSYFFGGTCDAVDRLNLDELPAGSVHRLALSLVQNALGNWVRVPVIVVRGAQPGPVFGLTAAVHGNELNGIRVIQRVFRDLDPRDVRGTIVGCPLVNVPGYLANRRELLEGIDLNRIMPGNRDGNAAEVYAHEVNERLLRPLNFLIDLHTASAGRENSLYVRADLDGEITREMAFLQAPEIVIHNAPADGTVRGAADDLGIPAITVEVGNPQRFQDQMIEEAAFGIRRTMTRYELLADEAPSSPARKPMVCRRSSWIYAERGGLLEVLPEVAQRVTRSEIVAITRNLFGDIVNEYFAPTDGVIVGKSVNPVCFSGARVVHLGTEMG